jgi:hypothetical protein
MRRAKTKSCDRRSKCTFVVAPASAYTWAVAFARRLIPGAVFASRDAAVAYASTLAKASGVGAPLVVIDHA